MLYPNPMQKPLRATLAAALFAATLGTAVPAWGAPADDLREAQKLYGQQKLQPALDKVDVFLKAMPRDPQGRFLKGLLLTEQKRIPEAIQVFTGLTEDFPELPEPYNNLAVLYAQRGDYGSARLALETAVRTAPNWAVARENLGDIYARLAADEYDRAARLDRDNKSAPAKLTLVRNLLAAGVPAKPKS